MKQIQIKVRVRKDDEPEEDPPPVRDEIKRIWFKVRTLCVPD